MKKDDEEEDDDDDMEEQISKLSKLSKTELVNQYTKGMTKSALAKGIVEYGGGMKNAMKMHGDDDEKEKENETHESVDVKKDVDALLEGEDFSDEFKTKA